MTPLPTPSVDAHRIERLQSYVRWVDQKIDGLEIRANKRNRLSAGCLNASHEYQKAIILLIAQNLHGPACALVRILFEACIRGIWINRCATDAHIADIISGKPFNKFQKLLEDIESVDGFESNTLTKIKTMYWQSMNGFTHTGIEQIARQQSSEFIESSYDTDELIEVLNFSCLIGSLTALEICNIANSHSTAIEILEKMIAFWPDKEQG